jgi:hypothetical protein
MVDDLGHILNSCSEEFKPTECETKPEGISKKS